MAQEEFAFLKKYKFYLLLLGVGFLVYFNSLFGSFIWDDLAFIQNNSLIHSLSNLSSFFLGNSVAYQNGLSAAGSYYRPLGFSIFTFIYSLSGNQTFLYHFIQLSIHIFNTILIFVLFKKFFKEKLAFFLSLFFLIHPINTEAVDYISALDDPLYFLFGMSALLLFINAKTYKKLIGVGVLLLLSLLAKETGIVFLAIIFAYSLLFLRGKKFLIKTSIIALLPLFFYFYLRFIVARMPLSVGKLPDVPIMTATLLQRIFTMPAIFWFYIKSFFYPVNLFTFQEWMVPAANGNFYFPLLFDLLFFTAIFVFGVWIWKISKKDRVVYIFFAVWLLVGIGIHLQFLPLDMTVAYHYFYFGCVGLIGLIGIIFQNIKLKNKNIYGFTALFRVILIVFLSMFTIIRNSDWNSGISLYSHDLKFETNDRMENLLAVNLINTGKYNDAQNHLENLLRRNPEEPILYVNLGIAYELTGNFEKADQIYNKGLSFDQDGAVYYNYARLLLEREGETNDAKIVAGKGLTKFPQNSDLLLIKAVCEYKENEKTQALIDIKRVEDISPNSLTNSIYNTIVNNQPL